MTAPAIAKPQPLVRVEHRTLVQATLPRLTLLAAVTAACRVAPKKSSLPVLANLKLTSAAGALEIEATNLDQAYRTVIDATAEASLGVTIPAQQLLKLLKASKADVVTLSGACAYRFSRDPIIPEDGEFADEYTDKEQVECAEVPRVTVQLGGARTTLLGLPAEEFPTFPDKVIHNRLEIPHALLKELVTHEVACVSTEESRPILNGVLIEIPEGDQRVCVIATNGHRLSLLETGLRFANRALPPKQNGYGRVAEYIVPPYVFSIAAAIFAKTATISFMPLVSPEERDAARTADREPQLDHAVLTDGVTVLYTRLIEGPYPNYRQVIPRDNPLRVRVRSERFLELLTGALQVAHRETARVRFALVPNLDNPRLSTLTLSAQQPDVGEFRDSMEVGYTGERSPIEIGFNGNYVTQLVRALDAEEVEFTFSQPERAATIQNPEHPQRVQLVMPLRLVD